MESTNSSTGKPAWLTWIALCLSALVAMSLGVVLTPVAVSAASTDVDLQTKTVSPTSTAGSPLSPGQTFTYTIGFTCSSVVQGDTCAGAVITDVVPQFTDVFGNLAQLIPGSITAPPGIWSSGPAFVGTAPNVRLEGTLSAGFDAGDIASLSFTATAPTGIFPEGVTQLDNTATVTGGDTSPTVSSFVAATAPSFTVSKSGPSTLSLDTNGTYTIRACPSPSTAAFPSSFTLTDTLPLGADFVSATSGGTLSGVDPSDGSSTVNWSFTSANLPWPIVNGCLEVTVTVRYAEDPASGNESGAVKTNTATGTFDGTPMNQAGVGTTLRGPVTSVDGTKTSNAGFYVKTGDAVTYFLDFTNTSEAAAAPLDAATLTDGPVPAGVTINTVRTGTWPAGVSGVVEYSTDGATWTTLAGGLDGGTTQSIAVNPPAATWFRWRFQGSIPSGWSPTGMELVGTVTGTVEGSLVNCVDVSGTRGAAVYEDLNSCNTLRLEVPQPHPWIDKNLRILGTSTWDGNDNLDVAPGDTIEYQIRVRNEADATGDLLDPVVRDCASVTTFLGEPTITLGTGWSQVAYDGPPCPADSTPLQFVYGGSPIAPGGRADR